MGSRGTGTQLAEVTFVRRDSQIAIRLVDNTTRAVCEAAKNLGARYFVAVDPLADEPVWGVFDMVRCQYNNPTPGEWATEDPVRTFPIEALDAAVMYAVMMLGRR